MWNISFGCFFYRKNSVSDEKIELKEPYVTKFVYRDELNKKPPSPSKVKKSVRFENSEPKILGEEDVENSFQKTSCGDHTVDNEKGMIRVKVRMTKQEAARMLSKCKGEGVLEFKDVAGDLVSVPINRFSIM
ncbi:Nipped-B-like protein [Quillaja saponaria]|uniref:Nipped-B-like protein n=1 Tax=Quillaja saponaria TaxID=32244 RepID=A0AAD7L620_QUISA|nr:Nipped-B-like protein [Quillaja saponaria]